MRDPCIRAVAAACAAAVTVLTARPLAAQAPAAAAGHWLLDYDGHSTNEVVWDRRLGAIIARGVPATMVRELRDALGGPPDPLLVAGHRYVSMSACMAHACDVKGFLWFDRNDGATLGAIHAAGALRLGSRTFGPTAIPAPARAALRAWLAELGAEPSSVRFIGRRGGPRRLPASSFTPPPRYRPAAGGPSFDCAVAGTSVARAICGDSALAALDVRIWRRADEVRRSHSTRDAREELVAFHDAWRAGRDARCASAVSMADCLRDEFARQFEALGNWLPREARASRAIPPPASARAPCSPPP